MYLLITYYFKNNTYTAINNKIDTLIWIMIVGGIVV